MATFKLKSTQSVFFERLKLRYQGRGPSTATLCLALKNPRVEGFDNGAGVLKGKGFPYGHVILDFPDTGGKPIAFDVENKLLVLDLSAIDVEVGKTYDAWMWMVQGEGASFLEEDMVISPDGAPFYLLLPEFVEVV